MGPRDGVGTALRRQGYAGDLRGQSDAASVRTRRGSAIGTAKRDVGGSRPNADPTRGQL